MGPGRSDAESLSNEQIQQGYKSRGEANVPLGVHGTYVGVDWDSCVADGAVLKHALFKYFYGIGQNIMMYLQQKWLMLQVLE